MLIFFKDIGFHVFTSACAPLRQPFAKAAFAGESLLLSGISALVDVSLPRVEAPESLDLSEEKAGISIRLHVQFPSRQFRDSFFVVRVWVAPTPLFLQAVTPNHARLSRVGAQKGVDLVMETGCAPGPKPPAPGVHSASQPSS